MILWLFLALLPQSPVAVVTSGARELTLRLKQQTVNPAVLPLFHLLLLFIVFPFLFASFKQNKKIKKRTAEKSISKRSERSCQINYWCYKTVLRSRRSCGWLRELISFGNRTAKQNQKTRKKNQKRETKIGEAIDGFHTERLALVIDLLPSYQLNISLVFFYFLFSSPFYRFDFRNPSKPQIQPDNPNKNGLKQVEMYEETGDRCNQLNYDLIDSF